MQVAYI